MAQLLQERETPTVLCEKRLHGSNNHQVGVVCYVYTYCYHRSTTAFLRYESLNCLFQRKIVICCSGIPRSHSCHTFNDSIMASFTSLYRPIADYVIFCAHTKFDGSLQTIFPSRFVRDPHVYL